MDRALVDTEGHRFPTRSLGSIWPRGKAEGFALEFDAQGIVNQRRSLTLNLILPIVQMNIRQPNTAPPCATIKTFTWRDQWGNHKVYTLRAQGPFSFKVTLSVAKTRTQVLHGDVRSATAGVSLKRLIITPTNTYIIARIRSASPLGGLAALAVPPQVLHTAALDHVVLNSIMVDAKAFDLGEPNQDNSMWSFDFDAPFFSYGGTTTLFVMLWKRDKQHRAADKKTLRLQFTVRFPAH